MTEKINQENAFEQKKKKPGLSTNRPSNNWALVICSNFVNRIICGIGFDLQVQWKVLAFGFGLE